MMFYMLLYYCTLFCTDVFCSLEKKKKKNVFFYSRSKNLKSNTTGISPEVCLKK